MSVVRHRRLLGGALAVGLFAASTASAATPTAEQALKLSPVQKDVDFDEPQDPKTCAIRPEQLGGNTGWVVRDANGQILRRFADSNADNVVDLWSYYAQGVEIYRDIDSNFNGKADQYRWLNTGGSRWGFDANEDGQIDSWKFISAEEASSEIVQAMATRDENRFARLMITADELKSLGLGSDKQKELAEKVAKAPGLFKQMASRQQTVTSKTNWVDFGGSRPCMIPAGTDDSTADMLVYDNAMAMIETAGKHGQIQLGSLIRVGDAWRVVDVPAPFGEGMVEADGTSFFNVASRTSRSPVATAGGPSAETQELLTKLEKIDREVDAATTPATQAKLNAQRADLVEQIAASFEDATDRGQWIRQLADTVSAAAQSGAYPDGVARLQKLHDKLATNNEDKDLAAYVMFRHMTADYGLSLQAPNADFAKIQEKWLESLNGYVKDYPQSGDTAEAMLQLAIAEEFSGEESKAKDWYGKIVANFPESPASKKAAGSARRIDSVGKTITLRGPGLNGREVDLAQYRGRIVVVQYWATWCEPCKTDMAELKTLVDKYGKALSVIGVSLDSSQDAAVTFLRQNPTPWAQIYEPGGLESRMANEMGVLTLPTMLLIGSDGKVVNRNVHAGELDREIKALIK